MEKQQFEEKSLFEERGQIEQSVNAIIILVVGVGVAVLVLIFVGVLGGQTFQLVEADIDSIANNVVTLESFTIINGTVVQLGHNFIQTGTLAIANSTGSTTQWGLGNFTINFDDGSVLLNIIDQALLNSSPQNASTLIANYTWGAVEIRTSIKNGIISGFSALEQTADFLPIIVLAVVIFLVLSLVLGFTAFGGGTAGGGTAL